MIYTSYWGNIKKLVKAGIEPIQISRVPPKGMAFNGRAILSLAPTWDMLKMSWEAYVEEYQKILNRNNPHEIVRELGDGDVALLCFEKNRNECHRSLVADWLNRNGYDVREYSDMQKKAEQRDEQLVLF